MTACNFNRNTIFHFYAVWNCRLISATLCISNFNIYILTLNGIFRLSLIIRRCQLRYFFPLSTCTVITIICRILDCTIFIFVSIIISPIIQCNLYRITAALSSFILCGHLPPRQDTEYQYQCQQDTDCFLPRLSHLLFLLYYFFVQFCSPILGLFSTLFRFRHIPYISSLHDREYNHP